ncbi:hypothetical protein [Streptomyces sp. NBC_01643]|uniref:hypothetical protein n=1 Tax=Streptomyces sp. NBC_01643 TaxID=2975906 RepID=UPI003865EB13|nr:hypothetical protein OHB03_07225 [Streptomyces sp. NBC_01643]
MTSALRAAAHSGAPISTSSIARRAGADPAFQYCQRDLLALEHASELELSELELSEQNPAGATPVSRASLQSGLGAPADIEGLQQTITRLEQGTTELTVALEEREAELEAAREVNRQLTKALNQHE